MELFGEEIKGNMMKKMNGTEKVNWALLLMLSHIRTQGHPIEWKEFIYT